MVDDAGLNRWLDEHGLAACAPVLAAHDVGLDILADLSDADLAEIGLSLGMRRRLLKAAAGLRGNAPSSPAAPPTIDELARTNAGAVPTGGERRHLTVMFSDVVGSTAMSAQLDAEEWRDLLAVYHKTVADAVARLGGYVAQKMGDGAMVYFGYPQANENDAERAVRAGLAVLDELARLNRAAEAAGRPQLTARVGVHAGPVVVDVNGFVFGEVPNVAARVQTAAAPGELVISAPVQRQVAGLVVAEDRGPQTLKGVAEPLELFRVLRAGGGGRRRFAGRPRTPFVGRGDELRRIGERWELARAGRGQLVLIVGDAGSGKSRLVEEFQSRFATMPHSWVELPCTQLLQNTPFHPMVEWARQRFGGTDVPADRRAGELEAALAAVGLDPATAMPLLAPMLDMPLPAVYERPMVSPEEERRRQIATLASWIVAAGRVQPQVIAVEDVQWADPSTVELIAALVEQCAGSAVLVIVTARPEFAPAWRGDAHGTRIALGPMSRGEAAQLVGAIVAGSALPAETIDAVVARSGGIPLFLEEVTRLLVEGGGRGGANQVPPTLQASLLARLDRLGPAKEVAQIGSVLGREFGWPLIRAVAGLDDDVLRSTLERLAEADMIHSQGSPPDASYRFNHALFQDAAYDALLKSRRRELHRAVAEAYAEQFADAVRMRPELIAHHLTEAGETDDAIFAWRRAGEAAMARGAFVEAGAHLGRGIGLLTAQPDAAQRVTDQFQMRSLLGQCYWACKGFGASETRAAFESALAIGDQVDDVRTLATVLSGLVAAMTQQGQFDGARSFADRLTALADRTGGTFERGWAALRQAALCFYVGDLAAAERSFGTVLALGAEGGDTAIGGVSLTGMATIYLPWLTVIAGDVEAARRQAEAGLRWSRAAGSPHDQAFALTGAVMACIHAGDVAGTEAQTRLLLSVTEQHNLRVLALTAPLFQAWAMRERGQAAEAVAAFEKGLQTYEAIGQKILLNWFLAMLAEAQAEAGAIDVALATADRAVSHNPWSPLYAPEALRIRAKLLDRRAAGLDGAAADDAVRSAEAALRAALADAQRVGAGLFVVTIATDLARLLNGRGRIDDARAVLAPALASFPKGADAKPWREARELLAQLGG